MTFLEHLGELRTRLIRCLASLLIGFAVLAVPPKVPPMIFHFITGPMRAAKVPFEFIYTAPTEAFMLYMQMCFFAAIFMVSPYILYQAWAFISPGLYSHEKRYAVPFILFGSVFFIMGGLFGHYFLFPAAFSFLGQYAGPEMSFKPKVSEYFSFYSWFLLALGLVFQIPIVIYVLSRIGLVTAGFLMRNFKYAVLAAFIIAAVITPSGDMVNQTALAIPILGLYLLGVLVAWIFGKPRRREEPGA
jgi:sec-independent protein translocase protein TatC